METKVNRLSAIMVIVALVFAFVNAASAQTTTTVDVRTFEVIAVDGNKLVVRDQKGTQEYAVPADFRFMTASVVIGSSIVMTVQGGPTAFGVPVLLTLGLFGYLMAFCNSII